MAQDLHKEYEDINRFFEFDMDEEELNELDKKLEEDPDFFNKLQTLQFVEKELEAQFGTIGRKHKQQIKSGWKTAIPNAEKKSNPLKVSWKRNLSIAASFLVLVAALVWFTYSSPPSPQQLAQQYWQATPIETIVNIRSITPLPNEQQTLQQTINLLTNKEYQSALDILNQLTVTKENISQVNLLKGQAYFGLNQLQLAVEAYQSVLDQPINGQKDIAYWLQALAYLQKGEKVKAQSNLNIITQERYGMTSQAEKLLEQL